MSTPIVRRRKKAVEVDTLVWSGRETDLPAARAFLGADLVGTEAPHGSDNWSLLIRTMERGAEPDVIPPGWVLICGVRGEHYACEPGILADTYDECPPAGEFFQPGHVYRIADGIHRPNPWIFDVRHVDTETGGLLAAFGFLSGGTCREPIGHVEYAHSWKRGWTDITPAGGQ